MFLHHFARFRAELRPSRFGLGSAGDAEGTGARHAAALRPRLEKLASHAQGRSHRRTRDRVGSLCHASSSSGDISRPCRTRGRSRFMRAWKPCRILLSVALARAVRSLFVFILATAPTDPAVSSWHFTQALCRSEYDQPADPHCQLPGMCSCAGLTFQSGHVCASISCTMTTS
jgi:hypothetical protein